MAKTKVTTAVYGKNAGIDSFCISIAFFRPTGSQAFKVNSIPVEDGQTLTISQNVGDLDTTKYEIVFDPGPGVKECYVIRIVPENEELYCLGGVR